MRSQETYRAARRNTLNKHGKRKLNPAFVGIEGSRGKSIEPSHKLYHPPVRANERYRGDEINVKSTVVRISG